SGGARGQGATEARLFAREGAKVVIGDLLEDAGKQVEIEINASSGACLFVKLDVTKAEDWQQAVTAAVARFGTLNVLVHNAGIGRWPATSSGGSAELRTWPMGSCIWLPMSPPLSLVAS